MREHSVRRAISRAEAMSRPNLGIGRTIRLPRGSRKIVARRTPAAGGMESAGWRSLRDLAASWHY